jgi:hypothetical protein
MSIEITNENLLENFKSRYVLEPNSGCWLWIGALTLDGYGQVDWAVIGGNHTAHRLSWKLFRGPLADGEHVLHSCDTPHCVNPNHLFKGNQQVNMADRNAKDRQSKGEDHGHARLSQEQAIAIISDLRTLHEIARDYDIASTTVSAVKTGRSWRHLDAYRNAAKSGLVTAATLHGNDSGDGRSPLREK